jgi:hypothetical protein
VEDAVQTMDVARGSTRATYVPCRTVVEGASAVRKNVGNAVGTAAAGGESFGQNIPLSTETVAAVGLAGSECCRRDPRVMASEA